MNVKTVVELPEAQLRFAERMVEEGRYPDIDSVLADGLGRMMLDRQQENGEDPLAGLADELRRRAALPEDQWIPWDGESMANRLKARLAEKRGRN